MSSLHLHFKQLATANLVASIFAVFVIRMQAKASSLHGSFFSKQSGPITLSSFKLSVV